jgi:hypothetical protein
MRRLSRLTTLAVGYVGISIGLGAVARAEAPEIYAAWRGLDITMEECLERASTALTTRDLHNFSTTPTSISGSNDASTAMFICLENQENATTVVMVVSGEDNLAAQTLRNDLKEIF